MYPRDESRSNGACFVVPHEGVKWIVTESKWMDLTEMAKKEVARLGRVALGRNNDTWATDRRIQFASDPTVVIATAEGPVEVQSKDAIWASSVLVSAPGRLPQLRRAPALMRD